MEEYLKILASISPEPADRRIDYDRLSKIELEERLDKDEEYLSRKIPLMRDSLRASRIVKEYEAPSGIEARRAHVEAMRKEFDSMKEEYIANIRVIEGKGITIDAVNELLELDHSSDRPTYDECYRHFRKYGRSNMLFDPFEVSQEMKKYGL